MNYFLTDHLGSVRVIVDGSGVVKERNDYYPFGSRHVRADYSKNGNRFFLNLFIYNGKDEYVTLDLDYLDYGSRMYDSGLGRWFGMDPQAEKYPWTSPYVHVNNNPIITIDPNGEDLWIVNPDGRVTLALVDPTRNILYALDWDGNITGTFTGSTNEIFAQLGKVHWSKWMSEMQRADEKTKNVLVELRKAIGGEENKEEMSLLFLFLADQTNVEWGFSGARINGKNEYALTCKSMQSGTWFPYDDKKTFMGVHSHVKTTGKSSEIQGLDGDKDLIQRGVVTYSSYYIYIKNSGNLYRLDRMANEHHVRTINVNSELYGKRNVSRVKSYLKKPDEDIIKFKH